MNKAVVAAITGAINAYMEQEGQAKAVPSRAPYPEASPWRLFGRQELMRARTLWHIKRANR
ncbi:MAG: hypothetical protein A2Z36_03490 [Chloroflexi bacterium RBG_19FT_COMBO_48_23]|nr:MAG: hypothetical protein A2Z36_03490 [Chloroflexi bacterium RBG_19FT_COMBO_48_23]